MLTGADLDTTHSLDGALVQISFPSQTQTSRQIAWANVIGVTSSNKKKKRKTEKSMLAIANYMEFLLIFSNHFSGEKWQQKSKEEKEER